MLDDLKDTIAELADDIASDMYEQYMNGNHYVEKPDLKWAVIALDLAFTDISVTGATIELLLNEEIDEIYEEMVSGE